MRRDKRAGTTMFRFLDVQMQLVGLIDTLYCRLCSLPLCGLSRSERVESCTYTSALRRSSTALHQRAAAARLVASLRCSERRSVKNISSVCDIHREGRT